MKSMKLELPEFEPCPYHPKPAEQPNPIAGCSVCWARFYFYMDAPSKLRQINNSIDSYCFKVKRAKQYIALRERGFATDEPPPRDILVVFALPDDTVVTGKYIADLMGGNYPVRDDAHQSPITEFLGWKLV
jgi:hypothetical protein